MAATVKVEIDGKTVEVSPGTMVMEAANTLGLYVPHFCYHKKLSIAANCRMCLVEVEKAPKPLPACATPVTDGMKVWTHSERAKQAQSGVMEFLLINHPLDCPICDQGGECQLQDLAVGYGGSSSRFQEEKRVVPRKDVGPLVAAEEMSRCIQCTRCVRFGQEIAGVMELGMMGRGEHSEIVSFVGRAVESELSGNMIDICPVGALTSKPFRYSARAWELARRRSISPHDSLGANLILQVKGNTVMRVLPLENEAINECWISDKDRFSYEALGADERLVKPMVRDGGNWREVDWETALDRVVTGLKGTLAKHGPASLGVLATAHSTVEELGLAARLARGLGSENVDTRLRRVDFSGEAAGVPWLGMPIADLPKLDRVLVIGSFLRKDHPLIANRFRQAAKKGQQVHLLHVAGDDPLIATRSRTLVAPAALPDALAAIVKAVAEAKKVAVPQSVSAAQVTESARAVAASLASGQSVGIFLGNTAEAHPRAATLQALAQTLAELTGGRCGVFGEAANAVGAAVVGARPGKGGLDAAAMIAKPRKAYLLLNVEPELDCHDPQSASAAMKSADFVVALTAFKTAAIDYAHVILPIAPFSETAGSFVNTEGRLQAFSGVARSLGDSRPGWKVLRVLGTMLGLDGFAFDTAEQVRAAVIDANGIAGRLDNRLRTVDVRLGGAASGTTSGGLERIADVPIHFADAIARRSPPLQQTHDARMPRAVMARATAEARGLASASRVKVRQGSGAAVLDLELSDCVPAGCLRVSAGHAATAGLGPMFGPIEVERA